MQAHGMARLVNGLGDGERRGFVVAVCSFARFITADTDPRRLAHYPLAGRLFRERAAASACIMGAIPGSAMGAADWEKPSRRGAADCRHRDDDRCRPRFSD